MLDGRRTGPRGGGTIPGPSRSQDRLAFVMPPVGVEQHTDARRQCAEPHRGRLPVDGLGMRELPSDHHVVGRPVRPQHHGLFADTGTRQLAVRPVPHQRELQSDDSADRLRQLAVPPDNLAADQQPGALDIRRGVWGCELREVPHDGGLGRRVV
jgi:hypothetical protein